MILRAATSLVAAVAILGAACSGRPPATDAGAPVGRPVVDAAVPLVVPVPVHRACGETGPTETSLPAGLSTGVSSIGTGTLHPGETATFGGVSVEYDPQLWIGNRETGHRGAALVFLVPREETGDGPWGDPIELREGGVDRAELGPYRLDAQSSREDPPTSVSFTIQRRSCPAAQVTRDAPEPVWMWVSSAGIRLHTLYVDDQMLQIAIDARADGARLDVTSGPYHHWLEPLSGAPRALRVLGRVVTIDEVRVGAAVSGGVAPVHARVKIERAPAAAQPDPPAVAARPCGAPAPSRMPLPSELGAVPAVERETTLAVGQSRRLGAISFEYTAQELEHPGRRGEPDVDRIHDLAIRSDGAAWAGPFSFGASGGDSRLARAGRSVVRMDAQDGHPPARLRLRTGTLRCARELEVPVPTGPTFLWLSTLGHGTVTFGPREHPVLRAQIYDDVTSPTLQLQTEHALYSEALSPDAAGRTFTMDGVRVEVVEVRATGDTRRQGTSWTTSDLVPAVHALLRVAPE